MSASAATRNDLHSQNVSLLNSQYKAAARTGMPVRAEDRHAELLGLDTESRLTVLTRNQDAGRQHALPLPADLPRHPGLG
jgi:pseudolysin/vibriolysin